MKNRKGKIWDAAEWVLWAILGVEIGFIAALSGCAWQGQRHQIVDPNNMVRLNSEWWSMRCLWMSSGIECYTATPYYTSGASVQRSVSDANSIAAAGTAAGNMIGASAGFVLPSVKENAK
jgi:hypothetical protein